jgi:hypothetical protein
VFKSEEAPEGLSLYVRTNGSVLRDILLVSSGKRSRLDLSIYKNKYRNNVSGCGAWTNKDHKLWCHLMTHELVRWNDG